MRVLILTASVGSGHVRAAQALEAALRELDPAAELELVDVLTYARAGFRLLYRDGYLGLASRAPHVLGGLYDATDREPNPLAERARRRIQDLSLARLTSLLRQDRWDAAVSTHFLPAEVVSQLKLSGRFSAPHAVVVTDFQAHRLWAQLPAERFFVATEETGAALSRWGVDAGCVSVTGIPVDPAFSRARRQRPGSEQPTVLLLSGGAGLGPVEECFDALLRAPQPCRIVAVAGRNEALRRALARKEIPSRHRVQVLGFTRLIHQLMADADVVVTKPGGLTVSEALASGAALILVHPVPGQETRNCDYLLENGAAVKADGPLQLAAKAAALLEQSGRLAGLRLNARLLGRPRAAFDAARELLELGALSASFPRASAAGLAA